MAILIACEESQEVCKAFRKLGLEAYSNDIIEPSGGHDEWHIQADAIFAMNTKVFYTLDGAKHYIDKWDMMIAFPPCTDLAISGARWFAQKIADGRQQKSIEFFMEFANSTIERTAIENPVGIMSSHYRKPDQIIQPYQFGHSVSKKPVYG